MKTWLITGISRGLGLALAQAALARGDTVIGTVRGAHPELEQSAGTLHILTLDMTDPAAVAPIVEQAFALAPRIDVIVNNAGYGLLGPAATLDRGEQLAMIDLNCRTLTELSLRFIPSLARHRGGILNVASISGFIPGPGMSVYNASKAYVISFSVGLRRELRPKGIRVTALCPGPVPTEFQARAGILDVHYPRGFDRPAEDVAREGYKGLMRNRAVVVPGLHNKLVPWLPRFLPRNILASLVYGQLRRWEDA